MSLFYWLIYQRPYPNYTSKGWKWPHAWHLCSTWPSWNSFRFFHLLFWILIFIIDIMTLPRPSFKIQVFYNKPFCCTNIFLAQSLSVRNLQFNNHTDDGQCDYGIIAPLMELFCNCPLFSKMQSGNFPKIVLPNMWLLVLILVWRGQ